jgi:hypothetical protein
MASRRQRMYLSIPQPQQTKREPLRCKRPNRRCQYAVMGLAFVVGLTLAALAERGLLRL